MQNKFAGRAIAGTGLTVIIAQVFFLVLYSVFSAVMIFAGFNDALIYDGWGYIAFSLLSYMVMMIPAAIVAVHFSRKEYGGDALAEMLPSEKVGAGKFWCAVFSCYVFCLSGNIISAICRNIAEANSLPVAEAPIPVTYGASMLLVQILTIGVLPALLEELLIRGSIFGFCRHIGPFFCGILSGFVFALFHCNFAQYPTAFMFGFITGYYVCAYRNIWISITAHLINNLISCLYSYDGSDIYFALLSVFYVILILTSMVCFGIMLSKYKLFREKSVSSSKDFFKILSQPLMLVFIAISVLAAVGMLMI